jgi:hypothetical protein
MNRSRTRWFLFAAASLLAWSAGCASPYRSDQGALVGGLGGAGLGAIVGNAVGHPGAGAAIGAGVGALSGAAVGGALDNIEAKNQAEIAARLGRPAPGAVTIADVIGMTRAGVPEDVIVTHIQNHGLVAPLQAADLIALQQQGISPRVVQAMQAPPPAAAMPPQQVLVPAPYPPPYWGPYPYPYPYYYRPRPAIGWSVAVGR